MPRQHNIAIGMDQFTWKKRADMGPTSEPYIISMAIDERTPLTSENSTSPFFNPIIFPNVRVNETVQMLGNGHLFYGPRDPGSFVALSILWMESDAKTRDLGDRLTSVKEDKEIADLIRSIISLASARATCVIPILSQLTSLVGKALLVNKDDEIYRTTGVFLRDIDPPYQLGTVTQRGNEYVDFNIRVMGL